MAPKSKATQNTTKTQKKFAKVEEPTAAVNYEEVQNDELQSLEAIYGEDFESVEVKGAWSKTTDRAFKLRLRSTLSDGDAVTMQVRLTATYPRTLPILSIEGLEEFHKRTQQRVKNILANLPKQKTGEAMIYYIAEEIRDALDDAIQAKQEGVLPSLDDERWSREQASTALAKEVEEAEARRAEEEQGEQDRMMQQMVDEEINRRESRKPVKPADDTKVATATAIAAAADLVTFDTPSVLRTADEKIGFTQVHLLTQLSKTRNQRTYLARPISDSSKPAVLAVKRIKLSRSREEVLALEDILGSLQKLYHPGLLNIVAYRIDKVEAIGYELVLCTEYADRGSLADLLDLGTVHISRARHFIVELLEGLDYLHRNGITHGALTAASVVLDGSPTISPKLSNFGQTKISHTPVRLPLKWQAPEGETSSPTVQRKTDIWYFGILVMRILLPSELRLQYGSPQLMLDKVNFSNSFYGFLQKMFALEPKKRSAAFELLAAEFLRTEDLIMDDPHLTSPLTTTDSSRYQRGSFSSPVKRRSRHNSTSVAEPLSRYSADFTELGRLGKGGFGEVVKARNKLDGGVYAVKKIKQAPNLLDKVLSEVMVLNRLNHPYVVRYFSTWIEEDPNGAVFEDSTTETGTGTGTGTATDFATDDDDGPQIEFGYQSTGGLDIVSTSGLQIQFGEDDEDENDDNEEENDAAGEELEEEERDSDSESDNDNDEDSTGDKMGKKGQNQATRPQIWALRKARPQAKAIMYIQMEYCERHTLRDIVRKVVNTDDSWRYARQITEGLAHIHGHGIIHRDLKPDNIFIDVAGNPKIGDFGLATTAHHSVTEQFSHMSGYTDGDMTRSIGTTLYVAPELRSGSRGTYTDKVDMYSLGIMFYEMCEPFSTGMERIKALQEVREKNHELPAAFQANGDKALQGRLISCLISHKPSERLSSAELLRSELLPMKIEDETIRQALSGLSDPKSPYHQRMMSALFSQDTANTARVKAMVWDARIPAPVGEPIKLRARSMALEALKRVFHRHGAEEVRRQSIIPSSDYYASTANAVQLLDSSGNLLQLPYDLILPHARQLGRQHTKAKRCYSFGTAFRDNFDGPPRENEEVDFDLVTSGGVAERQMNDAEVLKVVDEIVCEMPLFAQSSKISFYLNDARILSAVLEHCRIPASQQTAVKEVVSRLGFNEHTWAKVRAELRKFGLLDTTLDDLKQFDFHEVSEKAFNRLRNALSSASARLRARLNEGIDYLTDVLHLCEGFGIQRKIYVSPLGGVNAKFYEDSFLFQCVMERKPRPLVIAAGGRYDSLIKAHRPPDVRSIPQGAVGVLIGLDHFIDYVAKVGETSTSKKTFLKEPKSHEQMSKRCDVCVLAVGTEMVQMAGIKLVSSLWAGNINAELSITKPADINDYHFLVTVRHETSTTVKVSSTKPDAEEYDVPISNIVNYVQQELRDLESSKPRHPPALLRQPSHPDGGEKKGNVQVLTASRGSKKVNKYQVVLDAQDAWARKLDTAKDGPILAVETRDDVLDFIQQTRLSDGESWRKAIQSCRLDDRQYVAQIQDKLEEWRKEWLQSEGVREAAVFNFRTQRCIYYDLGL